MPPPYSNPSLEKSPGLNSLRVASARAGMLGAIKSSQTFP